MEAGTARGPSGRPPTIRLTVTRPGALGDLRTTVVHVGDVGGPQALPEGPVTIMFTDIEGSTALRTSLGDAEADALFAQHDELIRAQIAEHRGQDLHAALGDGFLAVFVSTKRAVSCAVGIQKALDAFNHQRSGAPLRVRIGLNTGEVAQVDGQISGEAVHAAARVCSAADGGHVLVADVTRQLAGTIPEVSYRDTGEHELKGFPSPWRLWEVLWVHESAPKAVPFVGREDQLGLLRARLASTIDGHGGTVLVGGEPGVGKTALVRQLIAEAEKRGALAVFGRCYESEGSVAYSPFVEMLEQALSIMPPDVVLEDMGESAPEVARMVPELRRRFPEIPEAIDLPPEQQRRYFFNAVASFISRGAERFPLLLVMDDVHWADEPTLLMVEHIASLIGDRRILAIGTYRDVELEMSRPLAASLERMVRAQTVERVHLGRFDGGGVARMIEALSGRTPPDSVVQAVYSETEGNPFFVGEVYRHFVEEGRVFDANGEFRADLRIDELDVPESVRLVVGRRLERLGPEAQKALAAGAVIGRAFPFQLLDAVSDLSTDALLDVVDDAETAQVLVSEERDGEVVFSFAHELIRQTLLSGLSALRRQRIHLAVADAIESLDPDAAMSRAQEVADHLMKAGAAADRDRLVARLVTAAEQAMNGAAFESTLRLTEDATTLIAADDHARLGALHELRGRAFRALGSLAECLAAWNQSAAEHIEAGDVGAAGRVLWQMGISQIWLGQMEEAFVTYERAQRVLGDAPVPERLLVSGGLSALLSFGGLYDLAVSTAEEALVVAGDAATDRGLGSLHWARSVAAWNFGQMGIAMDRGLVGIEYLRRSTDAWTLADALTWTSFPFIWSGQPAKGRELAAEGEDLAAKIGHVGTQALAMRMVALASSAMEPDLDRFEQVAADELVMLESVNSPWVALTHAWIAAGHVLRGRLDQALHHADESIRLMPPSSWTGLGEGCKMTVFAALGDHDRFVEMLDDPAFTLPEADGPNPAGVQFRFHGALVAVAALGNAQRAAQLLPLARSAPAAYPTSGFDLMITERLVGALALVAGELDEAEQRLKEADRVAREAPNRMDQPNVDYWMAQLLLARGRPDERDEAIRRATAARDEFARRQSPPFLSRAEALLAELLST